MSASAAPVRPATPADAGPAVETLVRAFADYAFTRHVIAADGYTERLRTFQGMFLERVGLVHGRVWVSDDLRAVAVWTTPDADPTPAFEELAPRVGEIAGNRAAAYQAAEEALAPYRPAGPAWFLATVGVDPDAQGRGLGGAVVRPGLEEAERAGVPAYLETSAERNVRFYERLGFEVEAEAELPGGGPRTWCMWRR
ncbi:Acetyltransferase (GNAT) family protein [Thermomonospora echinospora]|uniref:Acetyltransferase (GNAT) family protein n=1 Tax=Thermomonospora echinospora TaxID=1992 RepID=A0A1H5UUN5_9ACTN|nr:GNAT family N-acetyltransferase [Thermomonospora echinospora]SEF78773.1 Acetyltransferase (GNAT) family protein [Thermomonospora echinospora]